MIGVGVIGAGTAALIAHLPALVASDRLTLVGLCDTSRTRLDEALARFPAPGYTVAEELLADERLDAVVIATPPQSHAELAAASIRRGKHVLCEKPLAPTVGECRELVAAAAEAGVVFAVGHEKRFHPTLRRVCDLVTSGGLGTVFYAGVHWAAAAKLEPERLIPEGFRHGYEWRWRDPAVGGGLVQDHLPHYVDLLRFWTGEDPVELQGQTFNVARNLLGWPPEDSVWEDFGLTVVRFSGGTVLRFETSVVGRSLSPLWSVGSGLGEWTEYGYLLGTDGQLVFDLLPWDSSEHGRIALTRRGGEGWVTLDQPEPQRSRGGAAGAMFRGQLEAWADAIEGRPSAVARGEDGLICVAAVEAAYRAAGSPTGMVAVESVDAVVR
jgi:predicted dehydrogenase